MNAVAFTVVSKKGIRWAASNLTPTFLDGTMDAALSFVSSGRMMTLPATEIEAVEYHFIPESHGICNYCDQQLSTNILQGVRAGNVMCHECGAVAAPGDTLVHLANCHGNRIG